ncbi:coiled-coil domain-containing protein 134-like [Apostichopus japonicus]|uniref:coiled-coil domain-containing protein 134-like n=1 Tax=Stichopus japonicus TaxID=307972 RepID=UPI003AB82E9C
MASTVNVMKFVMILLVCQYQVMCEHGDSAPSSTTNDEPHKQTTDENKNLPEDVPNPTGGDGKDSVKDDEKRSERDLQTFRKLYLQKRAQHIAAVDSLLETYEYEKTYQMVDLLITRMRTVVGTSRSTLVQKGFEPGMSFPTDEETKEALSIIMENAGLFGDMALKLPEITHACLEKKKSDVANILKWAITYSSDVGFLDEYSTQMFNLASQELNIIPKEPGFFNPYRQQFQPPQPSGDKKKKAKSDKKRGPRVTKVEL